ncbi:Bro-N domain-containing protein [Achromobacter spanius]|uniref:BRO-N domain-containing protein n=1 Tax=Achromobacter spanius TaxID=217203 RepID=UPI001CB9BB34|nr:Bro-N domain-containing protein [Achromobacter spanius]
MRNVQQSKASRQVPAAQSALDIARDEDRADQMHEARVILASQKGEQRAVVPQAPASPFNFGAHPVRVVVRDGQPWFVAADVCAALDYKNASKAVADHLDPDERSNEQLDRSRMGSKAVIINESGLYALVLRSRKPEARKFAKWVTSEVLPQIRKTGAYLPKEFAVNPGDVLTKEQQDVLRQLVKSTADRLPKEKQGGAMTKMWSKLKAHFGVRYRDIPQQEYTEAISLLTRAATEWELVDDEQEAVPVPADRQALAFSAASQVAAIASRTVFESVLAGDGRWETDRWVFGVTIGNPKVGEKDQEPYCFKIERGAVIASLQKMAEMINAPNGMMPSNAELAALAEACSRKLSSRLAYAASKAG